MEHLKISTITCILQISDDIDLKKVYEEVPITNYIPFIEYGAANTPKGFSKKIVIFSTTFLKRWIWHKTSFSSKNNAKRSESFVKVKKTFSKMLCYRFGHCVFYTFSLWSLNQYIGFQASAYGKLDLKWVSECYWRNAGGVKMRFSARIAS